MSHFIMLRRVLLDRYVELLNYMSPSFPPTTLSPPSCILMDVYNPCFAPITMNKRVTAESHFQEVRLIELSEIEIKLIFYSKLLMRIADLKGKGIGYLCHKELFHMWKNTRFYLPVMFI